MAYIDIKGSGTRGIVHDFSRDLLPDETWTDGYNVRFINGEAQRTLGHTEVFKVPEIDREVLSFPANDFFGGTSIALDTEEGPRPQIQDSAFLKNADDERYVSLIRINADGSVELHITSNSSGATDSSATRTIEMSEAFKKAKLILTLTEDIGAGSAPLEISTTPDLDATDNTIEYPAPADTTVFDVWFARNKVRANGSTSGSLTFEVTANVDIPKYNPDPDKGEPPDGPYWITSAFSGALPYWLYATPTKLWAILRTHHWNITRQKTGGDDDDYAMSINTLWNGAQSGAHIVLTNGIDVPQTWLPSQNNTRAVNLVNWPGSGSVVKGKGDLRCKIIRALNYHLIALNLEDREDLNNVKKYPQRIRWSHPAVPGALPSSWDITDPKVEAGELDIPEVSSGDIITAEPFGRYGLFIYKNSSTWLLQYIGGNLVFGLGSGPIFNTVGALSHGCVRPFSAREGNYHAVFTGEDIVIHDGRRVIKNLQQKAAKWLRSKLDPTTFNRSFIVHNQALEELWFCFPSQGAKWPSDALIWNYQEDTLGHRELTDETTWMALGIIGKQGEPHTWDAAASKITWEAAREVWDEPENLTNYRLVECNRRERKFFQTDLGDQLGGQPIQSKLERTGITISGIDNRGQIRKDLYKRKLLKGAKVRISSGNLAVSLGASERFDHPPSIEWKNTDPGNVTAADATVYTEISGNALGIRLEDATGSAWKLEDYSLDIEELGEF